MTKKQVIPVVSPSKPITATEALRRLEAAYGKKCDEVIKLEKEVTLLVKEIAILRGKVK